MPPNSIPVDRQPLAGSLRITARGGKPQFSLRLLRSVRLAIQSLAAAKVPVLVAGLHLVFALSCAASAEEVKRANNSGYNTDFATVYGETLAAVTKLYPRTAENAVDGTIRTAWHRVAVQTGSGRSSGQQAGQVAGTNASAVGLTSTVASDRRQYFIRFRVHVLGGKPWRVRVVGEASEWAAGDVPMPLKGAEVPPWVQGRTDALRVAIHKRLKSVAVRVEKEIPQAEGTIITIDEPPSFGDIPEGAQALLEEIHRTLSLRAFGDLRAQLADDVQWSPGENGNADVAMAMWQADTSLLEAMRIAIGRGCISGDGNVTVSCPRAFSEEPNYQGHRLIAEERDGRWVVTAFVSSE